jgi:GT2 family glycosyltransferase
MASTPPPILDAVTINFNGGQRILKTVGALLRQRPPLRRIHVIDNSSTDGSPEMLRRHFPQVLIHAMGRNAGLSAARNVGLRMTDAPYVLLIDNDLYVADDCIAKLLSAQRDTGAAVICPRIVLHPADRLIQADGAEAHFIGTLTLRHGFAPVEKTPPTRDVVGGSIGACMLIDRHKVLEAGGFDETYFFYFEDLEFMLRMRSLGHDFVCEARATVSHDRGDGTPGLSFRGHERYPLRRAYLTMHHRLLTMLIHYRLRTLLVLSPALAVYELATFVLAISRGWGGAWFQAWWWQLANRGLVQQKRQAVQSRRMRSDRELLSGGPLPLAQGLLRSAISRVPVRFLSGSLNAYWRIARYGIR